MKTKNYAAALAALLLITLFATAAHADIYLEQKTTSKKNSGEETLTSMYISNSAIRVEEPGGKIVNITDFQGKQLITLDTDNKEFFAIPLSQIKEDLRRGAGHFRNAVDMNWRMEVSPETREIAGYQTRKYVFHGRGEARNRQGSGGVSITLELWIGEGVPVPESINQRILDALGIDQNPFVDTAVVDEIRKLGGYPLRSVTTIEMDTVNDVIEQEVILLTQVEADPSRYHIPSEYQEIEPQ